MPTVTIAITSGTRWRVPVDCKDAIVECIGGGAVGGGAYSKTSFTTAGGNPLTPLSVVYIAVGSAGVIGTGDASDTWFNKSSNSAPTTASPQIGCLAKGGRGLNSCAYATATGGQKSAGVGDVRNSGGNGYGVYFPGVTWSMDSAGGAGGPNGDGGNGYQGVIAGGGGGANGGAPATGLNGGNNRLGSGGGAGGSSPTAGTNGGGGGANTGATGDGAVGSVDTIYTDYLGNTYGPAGGAGGANNTSSTAASGTNYGGGGGNGSQGLIIITYTPVVTIGNSYTEVLNTNGPTDGSTPSRWRIPYGVETVTIHAIGSGSVGSASNFNGGGGGAYASSTVNVNTLNNTNAYYLNYFTSSGFGFFGGSDAWFNKDSTLYPAAPTTATNGALAKGATYAGSTGGQASSSVGEVGKVFSGGNGGNGGGTTINKGGGGGGSAGPSGAGKNGGNVFSSANSSGSGGGGGGSNGGSSTAGGNSTAATTAGAGGAGTSGSGGGAAGTATTNAGSGSNGGGGGGGKNTTGRTDGGNGGMQAIWTDSGTSVQYGPSGGGGGNAALTATNYGAPGVPSYGGGCGIYAAAAGLSYAGQPLLVLQYTITKAAPTDATGNMFLMF